MMSEEKFNTIEIDKAKLSAIVSINEHSAESCRCRILTVTQECPCMAMALITCGSCSYADADHAEMAKRLGHKPFHEIHDDVTFSSMYKNKAGAIVTFRNELGDVSLNVTKRQF